MGRNCSFLNSMTLALVIVELAKGKQDKSYSLQIVSSNWNHQRVKDNECNKILLRNIFLSNGTDSRQKRYANRQWKTLFVPWNSRILKRSNITLKLLPQVIFQLSPLIHFPQYKYMAGLKYTMFGNPKSKRTFRRLSYFPRQTEANTIALENQIKRMRAWMVKTKHH